MYVCNTIKRSVKFLDMKEKMLGYLKSLNDMITKSNKKLKD